MEFKLVTTYKIVLFGKEFNDIELILINVAYNLFFMMWVLPFLTGSHFFYPGLIGLLAFGLSEMAYQEFFKSTVIYKIVLYGILILSYVVYTSFFVDLSLIGLLLFFLSFFALAYFNTLKINALKKLKVKNVR